MRIYWADRVVVRAPMFERTRGELAEGEDAEELLERALGPLYVRRFISRRPIDDAFIERAVVSALGR